MVVCTMSITPRPPRSSSSQAPTSSVGFGNPFGGCLGRHRDGLFNFAIDGHGNHLELLCRGFRRSTPDQRQRGNPDRQRVQVIRIVQPFDTVTDTPERLWVLTVMAMGGFFLVTLTTIFLSPDRLTL